MQLIEEPLLAMGVTAQHVTVTNEDELIAAAADADVLVPAYSKATARVIAALTKCRLLPSGGIGYDHIDLDAATARGILVTNMADVFVDEVANHAIMLLLNVARRTQWLHEMVVTNRWRETATKLYPVVKVSLPRITGETLGLLAFGNIARATAVRGHALGMTVLAYDPYIPDEVFQRYGVERVCLDDLASRSDYVSAHLPLTDESYHLVNESLLRKMKKTAIFANTGRGRTVDEPALIRALQEGWIAGAGLDVLEQEPPAADNPLFKMPNVLLTPHIASASDASWVARWQLLGKQITDVLSGRLPHNVVNKSVVEGWLARA